MDISGLHRWLMASGTLLSLALPSVPLKAAVVCTSPGVPVGCVQVQAAPARVYGRPVVNPTPGVGYGAPGVGVRPAAGPGVGPNAGGPVNRAGYR